MIGNYSEGTTSRRYRDIAEYATMKMLLQTMPDLQSRGVNTTVREMLAIRDSWVDGKGNPIDLTTSMAKASDFERLLKSTGAQSFGTLGTSDNLRDGIGKMWSDSVKEYDSNVAKGIYLHAVTDPELREHIPFITPTSVEINRATFERRGKSARDVVTGDTVAFYRGNEQVYSGRSTGGRELTPQELEVATKEVKNRRPASVVLAEAQSAATTTTAREGFNQASVLGQGTPAPTPVPAPVPEHVAAIADDFEDAPLMGWNGGTTFDDRDLQGLSHVLGAYVSRSDGEKIAKNIDPLKVFPREYADNAVELLQHMRSEGYDIKYKEQSYPNQIEMFVQSGENVSVKVFDETANGSYMGRVYDTYSEYYYNISGGQRARQNAKFDGDDAKALLGYVMGNQPARVIKSNGSDTSNLVGLRPDRRKAVIVKPLTDRYASTSFGSQEEAQEYIEDRLVEAQSFVADEFKLEDLQRTIDEGLDSEDVLVTSTEFQASFEQYYSVDDVIKESQMEAIEQMYHSESGGIAHMQAIRDSLVGNYEDGFNSAFVVDHSQAPDRGNARDAMLAAIKVSEYDVDKIKGNDFAINSMKERVVKFNPLTAVSIDDVEHPMVKSAMDTVQKTLAGGGFIGVSDEDGKYNVNSKPTILIDDQGVIEWQAARELRSTKGAKVRTQFQDISGEIGQIMVPDEHGIIKTNFQGGNNYGMVPGYTGYFSFEGDYQDRMDRFRVKGFDQHMSEQLRASVTHQMTRPIDRKTDNISTVLDASGINGLYHGDVYGQRIPLDFMEVSALSPEIREATLTSLSNRVRFDNQYSDYATTSAETQANRNTASVANESEFSYWKVAGSTNMRELGKPLADEHGEDIANTSDIDNYADTVMTGNAKTQGLVWFLADGTEVNSDGTVTPSKGILQDDGTYAPDETAVHKLPYFDNEKNNAWDRTQMSANQLMTAERVDEDVNTALMTFGGWTFDDGYVVSKEFAERNLIVGVKPNEASKDVLDGALREVFEDGVSYEDALKDKNMKWSKETLDEGLILFDKLIQGDEDKAAYNDYLDEHGTYRPLQRGDKLSDFGGNKGIISIVIDRDMPEDEAKKLKLDREVAFMKENDNLDVIGAPYSMLSRHNAGVIHELMDGEVQDLKDPLTGETFKDAMGKLNFIVTDMAVDSKTKAYSREDVLDGRGRKASGQLAWALQSKDAQGILNEIYGHNDTPWETYREYLITTGLDMAPDGTIMEEYTPHEGEERNEFAYDPNESASDFLDKIRDEGGFLETPFPVVYQTGAISDKVPVLSAGLRRNVELVDGTMRASIFTNHYEKIYEAVGDYETADTDEKREKARIAGQNQFDKIQSTIIDRQFNGSSNGKNSFIRDKIMSKRMMHSGTGVAMPDPRLNIGEAGMNQEMMDALNAKEGDTIMAFRDPVMRDGAIRSMKVVHDETVDGVAFNPMTDKSHDGDFDGDTYGLIKFDSKEANDDLIKKFSHEANMIDPGNGKDQLYFHTHEGGGMDLSSAYRHAVESGDTKIEGEFEKLTSNAQSPDIRRQKQACGQLNKYAQKLFREHSYGSAYVSLTDDESVFNSFEKMVEDKAKGSPKGFEAYKRYHHGDVTRDDGRKIQYATGVKTDDTGLAGGFSQRLVSGMRNHNMSSALESMQPLTQGVLQIKHSAEHAEVVNGGLTHDMNQIFRGVDPENYKRKLTPTTFKSKLTDTLTDVFEVDVAEKHIDALTEMVTHNGGIIPLREAVGIKGSPMDRVAYGGGYDELKNIARKGESLLEGKYNKLFAPHSMRNATPETVIARKDTQRDTSKDVIAPKVDEQSTEAEQVASALEYDRKAVTEKAEETVAEAPSQVVIEQTTMNLDSDDGPDM